MKKSTALLLATLVAALCWMNVSAWADPSLPITKPPVIPSTQMTGPPIDVFATQGQWFKDSTSGEESCRTNEFYDNVAGGTAGHNAITGYVDSITYAGGPGTPITAFSIKATIYNDTNEDTTDWMAGENSHGETNTFMGTKYYGPLVDTKLTAEFAITDVTNVPTLWTPPYFDYQPYIVADNEDQAGWYCWNPEDEDPEHGETGAYYVPTWDFGTIAVGASSTRTLSFTVPAGLPSADPRYSIIVSSEESHTDILLNRTTSLKISTWIDDLAVDDGTPYPIPPRRSSDVSVFHNRGEVDLDFGDAPDPTYPTLLANDGARHVAVVGIMMGPLIDWESDGQPDPTATGDNLANLDDENGVVLGSPLTIGNTEPVAVTVSIDGYLSAWIDFDIDGSWTAAEQIFSVYMVTAGVNNLTFSVPASSTAGTSFSRWRFTTLQTTLYPTGLVSNGEVEDYEIELADEEEYIDFGDAWDAGAGALTYPTLLVNNGARHTYTPGVHMGANIDFEPDGQPTLNADGDDLNPLIGPNDEDGVTLPAILYAGDVVAVEVVASVPGYLDAWIDWNANSSWADPGEQVFTGYPLVPGINYLNLPVPMPPALVAGGPHSRWRFCTTGTPLTFTGLAPDGEVEDYEVQLEIIDLGDAPSPYPTLRADDGARHRVPTTPVYWMGSTATDIEPDGIPEADALGDDLDNSPDEDGVAPAGTLILGSNANLNVTVSAGSYLNAWLDFNRDGDWADSGEQIATDLPMLSGANLVPFTVPLGASPGQTFGRFRISSVSGLSYTGLATDGEVEDHTFTLYQDGPSTPTNLVFTNIVRATTNDAQVWWVAETSVVYQVQFTTNLVDPPPVPWNDVSGTVIGPTNTQTDTNANERMHFYRVIAPFSPPPP